MPIFSSGYPEKTSNSDEDRFLISDSTDSNKIKGTKWSTIKSSIQSYVEGFTDWITTSMLKNDSVNTSKILNGAVTPEKLALGADSASNASSGTTASQSFTATLSGGGTNPSVAVVVPASGAVLITLKVALTNSSTAASIMSYRMSGANTFNGSYERGIGQSGSSTLRTSGAFIVTGLTPGLTTFQPVYIVSGSTGTFSERYIGVVPL